MPLLSAKLNRNEPMRSMVRAFERRFSAQCLVAWSAATMKAISSQSRRVAELVIDCPDHQRVQ